MASTTSAYFLKTICASSNNSNLLAREANSKDSFNRDDFLLAIAGIAIIYFLINEKFEWIPESALELTREKDLLERPEAKRCADCHKAIYDSWKKSRHSISWTSKTYIEASENHTKEKCLACHIPESVQGEKPSSRLDRRDEGIYCVSCHFINNKMNGPYDLVSPPHPTYRNPDYVRSNFCGSCHQKTFKEWQAAKVEDTCQNCHMPRKKGRLTQKIGLNLLHKKSGLGITVFCMVRSVKKTF